MFRSTSIRLIMIFQTSPKSCGNSLSDTFNSLISGNRFVSFRHSTELAPQSFPLPPIPKPYGRWLKKAIRTTCRISPDTFYLLPSGMDEVMLLLSCGRKHREDASGRAFYPIIMAVGYAVHSKRVVLEVTARGWCLTVEF